jgi:hypothetical protein
VATRGLVALAFLKPERQCSAEHIGNQLRTDLAVLDAGGSAEGQGNRPPAHCVLPEVLPQCRRRVDDA